MKAGERCPKCGWHITPMNMMYHRGVFVTEAQKANGETPTTDFDWKKCTEPHPNKVYLAKYNYNHETEEWE
ncbi:MAG: hypothetical protein CMI60_00375 [Parvibaculum sp.]|nr:hypothetical protein [Parvibaculum sp.]